MRPGAVAVVSAWAVLLALLAMVAFLRPGPLSIAAILVAFLLAAVGRSLVANLVNGVWLRRGGVVATGHYIRLEGLPDIEGYVERIGARTTLIQTPSGDLARVPNTILANSVFTSFHLDPAREAVTVDVEADADVSPRRVVSVLRQETKALAHSVPGQVAGPDRIQ